jgi:hypothetical protein
LSERPLKALGTFQHTNSSRFKEINLDRSTAIIEMMGNSNIDYMYKKDRSNSWSDHGDYSFVISPAGYGLCCYRTWEALILGCIPILKTSPIDSVYDSLPVIIVDEWSDITEDNMNNWKISIMSKDWNLEKLTSEYWSNRIRSLS